MNEAIDIGEQLARAAIPDLDNVPLYVHVARNLPGHCEGFYSPRLCETLRPQLERQGSWRGPGIAIVLDPEKIRAGVYHPIERERAVVGTLLHEVCHVFDLPEPAKPASTPPKPRPSGYASTPRDLAEFRAKLERQSQPTPIPAYFWSHTHTFTRLACHTWHRVNRLARYPLDSSWLRFAGEYPTLQLLSSPADYIDSLRAELIAQQRTPLRTVATLPPPAAFTELWRVDERRVWDEATRAGNVGATHAQSDGPLPQRVSSVADEKIAVRFLQC